MRPGPGDDGVDDQVGARREELVEVGVECGGRAEGPVGPPFIEVGVSPYVLVQVGEMLGRETLQCHVLASQGLEAGEVRRVGIGDNGS